MYWPLNLKCAECKCNGFGLRFVSVQLNLATLTKLQFVSWLSHLEIRQSHILPFCMQNICPLFSILLAWENLCGYVHGDNLLRESRQSILSIRKICFRSSVLYSAVPCMQNGITKFKLINYHLQSDMIRQGCKCN